MRCCLRRGGDSCSVSARTRFPAVGAPLPLAVGHESKLHLHVEMKVPVGFSGGRGFDEKTFESRNIESAVPSIQVSFEFVDRFTASQLFRR